MDGPFQLSLRNAFIAMTWVVVLTANFSFHWAMVEAGGLVGTCVWAALLGCSPAAATGAFIGRPLIGLVCGLSNAAVMVGWCVWMYLQR
jgi:hypothetical protein